MNAAHRRRRARRRKHKRRKERARRLKQLAKESRIMLLLASPEWVEATTDAIADMSKAIAKLGEDLVESVRRSAWTDHIVQQVSKR